MAFGSRVGDDVGGVTVVDEIVFEKTRDVVFFNINDRPHMIFQTGPIPNRVLQAIKMHLRFRRCPSRPMPNQSGQPTLILSSGHPGCQTLGGVGCPNSVCRKLETVVLLDPIICLL